MLLPAGIALGSNIEPRQEFLDRAIAEVEKLHEGSQPALRSKTYQTEPEDCPPGSDKFLNAAIEIATSLNAFALLRSLNEIESFLGRSRSSVQNAPRPIDLDLIYLGNSEIQTPDLILPHPRALDRGFVVYPFADIFKASAAPCEFLEALFRRSGEIVLM